MAYKLRSLPLVALFTTAAFATLALADNYPSKPIKIIVPAPPGGVLDIVARRVGNKLAERLGQPIVVDNRPGAGGNIAAEAAARAKPDGYTLLVGAVNIFAINPWLYPNLSYDPAKDFIPITEVARGHPILLVNPQLPVKNLSELIALAKAKPGQLSYASPGIGSVQHIAGERFKTLAGLDMVHVPYKGSPQAMTDLMGGQVQLAFEFGSVAAPLVQSGKLRALVIAGPNRKPVMPDVPTAAEVGLPQLEIGGWNGFFAPAHTPQPIIERLHKEIVQVISAPDITEYVKSLGSEVVGNSPAEFAAFVNAERARWGPVIKMSGARLE